MQTSRFPLLKLTKTKLDTWIKFNYNVLLVGEKGVGKSAQIIEAFNRNNLKWLYFSGATLDPWTEVVGVPKPKLLPNGESIIEYIRPEMMNDELEAIFCDEYNRAHKKVKNALMELIQFKSINGRKFPKLRFIWAAINPEDADDTYDIDPIDPAQLDRFHVIANLPYEPDKKYFIEKFNSNGEQAVIWWFQQPELVKKMVSPRRLEYAVTAFNDGVEIADMLPIDSNITMLKRMLKMTPTQAIFDNAYRMGDIPTQEKILNDDSKFAEMKKFVLSDILYYPTLSTLLGNEKLTALFKEQEKDNFGLWVTTNINIGKNKSILEEIQGLKIFKNAKNVLNDISGILDSVTLDNKKEVVTYCKSFVDRTKEKGTPIYSIDDLNNSVDLHFSPRWRKYISDTPKCPLIESDVTIIMDYTSIITKIFKKEGIKPKNSIFKSVLQALTDYIYKNKVGKFDQSRRITINHLEVYNKLLPEAIEYWFGVSAYTVSINEIVEKTW